MKIGTYKEVVHLEPTHHEMGKKFQLNSIFVFQISVEYFYLNLNELNLKRIWSRVSYH